MLVPICKIVNTSTKIVEDVFKLPEEISLDEFIAILLNQSSIFNESPQKYSSVKLTKLYSDLLSIEESYAELVIMAARSAEETDLTEARLQEEKDLVSEFNIRYKEIDNTIKKIEADNIKYSAIIEERITFSKDASPFGKQNAEHSIKYFSSTIELNLKAIELNEQKKQTLKNLKSDEAVVEYMKKNYPAKNQFWIKFSEFDLFNHCPTYYDEDEF